jgi:NAD(P)-dependent dehydrogenase (short-subunit alcohol dehydrogenase family)
MYLDKFKLTGKVAVVTGAGRGIGFAIADALSEAGALVVITDMDAASADAARDALRKKGRKAESAALDVTDPRAVEAAAAALNAAHGKVDILVNNAGIAISFVPAETMDDLTFTRVMDVNVNGVFWCCRAFGKFMLAAGAGSIVNIGSMSGDIVNYPQEQSSYNTSKAAVHHLTRSLAAEWAGRGVRVNAVAPTYIATEMTKQAAQDPEVSKHWLGNTPMGRMGEPEEIASVVLFLAGEGASLMTGAIVTADGGYTCW